MIFRIRRTLARALARMPLWLHWPVLFWGNQKFLVGVGAVIFNDRGEVLLFKHTYRAPGYAWGLPSGWLQGGESPEEGIEREIFEESKLIARVTRSLAVRCARRVPRVDLFYVGQIEGGCFEPSSEVSEARFFRLDDLPQMLADQRSAVFAGVEAVGWGGSLAGSAVQP